MCVCVCVCVCAWVCNFLNVSLPQLHYCTGCRLYEEMKKEKLHPNSTKTYTSASVKRDTRRTHPKHPKHHNPPTTSHAEDPHTIPPPPVTVHPHTSRHPEPTTSGGRDEGGSEVKGVGKSCKVSSLQLAEKKSQQSQKQRLRVSTVGAEGEGEYC